MNQNIEIKRTLLAKVGRLFSDSKLKYTWEVRIDSIKLIFEFMDSIKSSKKRLFINKKKVVEEETKEKNYKLI